MVTAIRILRLSEAGSRMHEAQWLRPKPGHAVQVGFYFCSFFVTVESHLLSCPMYHPPTVNTRKIRLFHLRIVWLNCMENSREENLRTSPILQMKKKLNRVCISFHCLRLRLHLSRLWRLRTSVCFLNLYTLFPQPLTCRKAWRVCCCRVVRLVPEVGVAFRTRFR